MLLRNLNPACGLSNGSVGVLKYCLRFPREDDIDRPPTDLDALIVNFPDYVCTIFYPDNPTFVPIFKRTEYTHGGSRTNFPIVTCMATTIHKSQGLYVDTVYVDIGNKEYTDGMTFVAFSRCRTYEGLFPAPSNETRILQLGKRTITRTEKAFIMGKLERLVEIRRVNIE